MSQKFILLAVFLGLTSIHAMSQERVISSLGRIEPSGGIINLAGPSGPLAVIKELKVSEGDFVKKGHVVAVLDSYSLRQAEVQRLQAVLKNANSKLARQKSLAKTSATSVTNLDAAQLDVNVARADLAAANASLEHALVKSPLDAQVLEIHAQPGERIGIDGLLELGQTQKMYAVAEVYETDIALVTIGQ